MMLKNTKMTTQGSGISNLKIYRAWVPTQSGYLHFSHLSDPKPNGREKPSVVYWEQGDAGSGGVRYTALHQRRLSQDSPIVNLFPESLRPWVSMTFFKEDGRCDFVSLCWHKIGKPWCKKVNPPLENSTSPSGASSVVLDLEEALHGRVFLFEAGAWSGVVRNGTTPAKETFQMHVDRVRKQCAGSVEYQGDELTESFWNTREELSKRAMIYMDFTLERDGSITFVYEQPPFPEVIIFPGLREKDLHQTNPLLDRDRIAKQQTEDLFRFLKDMTHEHTYHAASSDSFLKAYPIKKEMCQISQMTDPSSAGRGISPIMHGVTTISAQEDAIWRQDVLRKFFATISGRALGSCSASKGFLCFAESFKNICSRTHSGFLIPADIEVLRKSLDLSHEGNERESQVRFQDKIIFFQTFAMIVAVLTILGLIDKDLCGQAVCPSGSGAVNWFGEILKWSRCNPIVALAGFVIIFRTTINFKRSCFLKVRANNIARSLMAFKQKTAFVISIGIFLAVLAFWWFATKGYLWILS